MITEEIKPSLASLQAELQELRKSVEELRTIVSTINPERAVESAAHSEPGLSFEEAAAHVREAYPHLLHRLSQ